MKKLILVLAILILPTTCMAGHHSITIRKIFRNFRAHRVVAVQRRTTLPRRIIRRVIDFPLFITNDCPSDGCKNGTCPSR